MVVKVYISGISGNKEVKKRQQRVTMIMDSRNISYEVIDITEPGKESDRDFMQAKSTSSGATVGDANPRHPLPPQIFNDEHYCGDYDQFDMANEIDELEKFLKMAALNETESTVVSNAEIKLDNGTTNSAEEKETAEEIEVVKEKVEEKIEEVEKEIEESIEEPVKKLIEESAKETSDAEVEAEIAA